MKLTQEKLKEILDYDTETGIFTWKINISKKIKTGMKAGYLNKENGYIIIMLYNKNYRAHRLAFLWIEGYLPENQVDHMDRDRSNNKWNNLREVSQICNSRNCNISKNNTSGITGVVWDKKNNKWEANIQVRKKIFLGYFNNLIDASRARWEAEIKYNFPNCNTTSSAYIYLKEQEAI